MGFTSTNVGGVHHLKGRFDEHADFDALVAAKDDPLRVNLKELEFINSLGLLKLIAFAKAIGDRRLELHDCPPVFVEAVNVMPLIVGGQSRVSRIKSVFLTFRCQDDHERALTVPVSAVMSGNTLLMPMVHCPKCRMPMAAELDSEPDEFFFFLTA